VNGEQNPRSVYPREDKQPRWLHALIWLAIIVVATLVLVSFDRSQKSASAPAPDGARIDAVAMFSGGRHQITSQEFRGGDVVTFMGGHRIDLRKARLAGDRGELEVFVVFGGVNIVVPDDWRVDNDIAVVFGESHVPSLPDSIEPSAHLRLKGLVMMGGVRVRHLKSRTPTSTDSDAEQSEGRF
jgi:hypothetical protein